MAEDQDDSQKTEEPTQHRIEEAVKKGQIVFSREVLNFILFFSFTLMFVWYGGIMMADLKSGVIALIESPHLFHIPEGKLTIPGIDSSYIYSIFLVPMFGVLVMVLAGGFAQTKFNTSWEPIKPNLERISILKGFNRLFSAKSLVEFIKGLIKMTVTGVICYFAVKPYFKDVLFLQEQELSESVALLARIITKISIWVCVALGLIAIVDYLYQRYSYLHSLRMSMQEIKEEYRQQEGDPHVKSKLKQIRMERARKRMMANVPKADVVITNPTHFAIALQYDSKTMRAPVMIAKGADLLAKRIREVAQEHKIPVISNPPLARALFDEVEIEEEIPTHFYKAVAEVIGFVYKLKGKKK